MESMPKLVTKSIQAASNAPSAREHSAEEEEEPYQGDAEAHKEPIAFTAEDTK